MLTFFALVLVIIASVTIVLQNKVATHISNEKVKNNTHIIQTVIAQLGQLTAYTEGIAGSMCKLESSLPNQDSIYHNSIPQIMDDGNIQSVIAGGGIWPEPYAHDAKEIRHSFFWGREKSGQFKFYNDYNDPAGPGYHNEEWYVPARYAHSGQAVWSQSYMDPYSYEPMVTCTIPYDKNGAFAGVSTIDLKLDGLHDFFTHQSEQLEGYIFAVDRNNRFLTFPNKKIAKSYSVDDKENHTEHFLLVHDFAKNHGSFKKIAQMLDELDHLTLGKDMYQTSLYKNLSIKLETESYQINKTQAKMLAAHVLQNTGQLFDASYTVKKQVRFSSDPILNEDATASVFLMPKTDWKIVVVTPVSAANAEANSITWSTLQYLSFSAIICIFIAYLLIRNQVINPLQNMTSILIHNEDKDHTFVRLPEDRNDDLGLLAHWFNRSTDALRIANDKIKAENSVRLETEKELQESHQITTESLESLSKSEASLASILNSISNGVIATDNNGIIIRCNPVAEILTAWTNDPQIKKTNVQEILLISDNNQTPISLKSAFNDRTEQKLTCILKNTSFIEYTISLCITPLFDASQHQIGHLFIFNDISKENELEQQLVQSQKMESVGQLAGGIAHDFNNLLGGINGFADLIRINTGDEKTQRFAEQIMNTANKAADLTSQLLAFSRHGHISNEVISLHHTINESLFLLDRTINKHIEITQSLMAENDHVLGDSAQLQSAILNLGINARDAMPNGGRILIRTCNIYLNEEHCNSQPNEINPGDYIKIAFSDDGKGMDSYTLQRIFEPFFTTKGIGKGTGLGLAAVYGIVKRHHGNIHVSSEIHNGCTFTIYLPVTLQKAIESNAYQDKVEHNYHGRVLVIDDEDSVRMSSKSMLEHGGFTVDIASSGAKGIQLFQQQKYDLVILDLMMPQMDGQQTLKKLKDVSSSVNVLISSGFSSEHDLAAIRAMGICNTIKKPFTLKALCSLAASCIVNPESKTESKTESK
ncbi:MAG: response regulator [Planctomycetes bacterium]|nr:response regulator [Planctomycetota bacterium]